MSSKYETTQWEKTSSKAGKYAVAYDTDNKRYLVLLNESNGLYMGPCQTTTDPGALTSEDVGKFWRCSEDGTFTHFGDVEAAMFDEFWWNGSSFDLWQYSTVGGSGGTVNVSTVNLTGNGGKNYAVSGLDDADTIQVFVSGQINMQYTRPTGGGQISFIFNQLYDVPIIIYIFKTT
jgi:hypothetical protein